MKDASNEEFALSEISLNSHSIAGAARRSPDQQRHSRSGPQKSVSRRRFMQSIGVGVAGISCGPARALSVTASASMAELARDGVLLWSIDTAWLAGTPVLSVTGDPQRILISLSGARYPGTDLSADFRALITGPADMPLMRLHHALASDAVEVPLLPWVNGEQALVFAHRQRAFTGKVGTFLQIRQLAPVHVAFSPALALHASAPKGWRVGGTDFAGCCDNLVVQRAAALQLLNSTSPLLRAHVVLHNASATFSMAPHFAEARSDGYAVGASAINQLRVELAEDGRRQRHQAFVSEGKGMAMVSKASGNDGEPARVLAYDPTYARSLAANGASEALWVAGQGQAVTPFGSSALLSSPASDAGQMRLASGGGKFSAACCAQPHSLSIASDASVSVAIRFPQPGGHASQFADMCPFTFAHKEILLDNAEISFKRPQGALLLRFRLHGFTLVRNWKGISLRCSDACRLVVLPGAQSVMEQAFFVAPRAFHTQENPDKAKDRFIRNLRERFVLSKAPDAGWTEVLARALKAYAAPLGARDELASARFPSCARISGDSQLVYQLAGRRSPAAQLRLDGLNLSLESLLDPELWELVVIKDALSSEEVRRNGGGVQPTHPGKDLPPANGTFLELPCSLYVSPNEQARFRPAGLTAGKADGYHDIFRLEGDVGQTPDGMPLRAVGARGFGNGKPPPHYDPTKPTVPDPIGFRTSLDMRDRAELVWLTSQWDRQALLGTSDVRQGHADEPLANTAQGLGIHVPRPFHATRLLLSSMGGSMTSLGRWDPPSLTQAGFALSVERWEHASTFARLSHEVVVYKGFLLPFGIRATLVKVTERREHKVAELGVIALPQQKFYIEVAEPVAVYSDALAPFAGRTWPFRQIALELRGRLQIEDPTDTQLCQLGQSAFRVCVGPAGYPFGFEIDGDAKRKGSAPLVFVDNTVAHDLTEMQCVTNAFNQLAPSAWALKNPPPSGPDAYFIEFKNAKVQYAPPAKTDDTSYVTTRMYVRLGLHRELVNSALIEASGKPPTYPEMVVAQVVIPALNRLTGADALQETAVRIAPLFREVGFDPANALDQRNRSEVFLTLDRPVNLSFSGKGDRAGAVGTPNMPAHNLSRTVGLMGVIDQMVMPEATPPHLRLLGANVSSKVTFSADQLFSPDAKLLGVLKLADLCEVLNLDEVPRFIESARHQIDAAADDVNAKVCQFVGKGKTIIDDLVRDVEAEVRKFESLKPLLRHLNDFRDAIAAIPCQGKPDIAVVAIQIGIAGQALDNARRCAESLIQNPALLLPSEIVNVISEWTALVGGLAARYEALKQAVRAQLSAIEQALRNAVEELKQEAGNFAAAQLEHVCTALVNQLSELVAAALPSERQFEQIFAVYTQFQNIYRDIVGLYREIGLQWAECKKTLATMASSVVFAVDAQKKHFIAQFAAAIRIPLTRLDTALRTWPQAEFEPARALYRRVEPSVDDLAATLVDLLHFEVKDMKLVPQQLARLRSSLRDLELALDHASGPLLRMQTGPDAYVTLVRAEIAAVRLAFGQACRSLGAFEVQIPGQAKETLFAALTRFRGTLAASSKVLPALADAVIAVWNPIVINPDYALVIDRTILFVNLCVMVRARDLKLPASVQDGYSLCPQSIIALDALLHATIKDVNDNLRQWIKIVIPSALPQWLLTIRDHAFLLGPPAVAGINQLVADLVRAKATLDASAGALADLAQDAFGDIIAAVASIQNQWRALAAQLQRIGEAPDRFVIALVERKLVDLASELVPAEIHLDFNFKTEITKHVSIFSPGSSVGVNRNKATLALNAEIRHNLIRNTSSSSFSGSLSDFKLNLMGFLILSFSEVRFEAKSGSGPKLYPPIIDDVTFDGCLKVIDALKAFFQGGNGPYVLPRPNGIKAGYRLSPGTIPLGAMILENLVIDAGIEIPFDDRAAVTSLTVSTRQSPALLFIPPYGGAMFFGMMMAGDRLVSIEASFEAGLVSAFNLGPVKGDGRITMGFYYKQSGSEVILSGFFFAGGAARILGVVSITVSLRISLIHAGSNVTGHGEFSVEVGCSPFEWTLDYSIDYAVSRGARNAAALQEPDRIDPITKQAPMDDLFLHDATWRAFRSAYANSEEIPCAT